MLPFLKRTQDASVAAPIEHSMRKADSHDPDGLHVAATDLIQAIKSNDIKGVAEALRAAFTLVDSEPHQEGEHTDEL